MPQAVFEPVNCFDLKIFIKLIKPHQPSANLETLEKVYNILPSKKRISSLKRRLFFERLFQDGRFHLLIPQNFFPCLAQCLISLGTEKQEQIPQAVKACPYGASWGATLMRHFTSTLKISVTSSSSTKHKNRPGGSDISQVVVGQFCK